MGVNVGIEPFDGSSGVSERYFTFLARTHCSLVMGFPVDSVDPDPPHGLTLTRSYLHTGYVIATLGKPRSLRSIPAGTTVSVSTSTVPNFYLVGALGPKRPLVADVYLTQEEALDALRRRRVPVAMVWQPSLVRYERRHTERPPIVDAPLPIPHARWGVAALYAANHAPFARHFNAALATLGTNGTLAHLTSVAGLEPR